MNTLKNRIGILFIISLVISCTPQDNTVKIPAILLENSSNIDRMEEPLVVSFTQIREKFMEVPASQKPLLTDSLGAAIPCQYDDLDGDGVWDELAFLASVPANSTKMIYIELVDQDSLPSFEKRTNVRFGVKESPEAEIVGVEEYSLFADEIPRGDFKPFQMDGPAWENDKIGFRHYFDGRNTRDFFGKTNPIIALDEVGIQDGQIADTYHEMNEWGRDILSVGNSLGLGGIGILHEDQAVRLGVTLEDTVNNVQRTNFRLISEGPVRSIFEINYEDWQVDDQLYDISNRVIIWAGKYWTTNQVSLTNEAGIDTLIVGLVNSNNDQPLISIDPINGWRAIATHDRQTYEKEWFLGMALILPEEHYVGYREAPEEGASITTSYNALLTSGIAETVPYHALGAWELSNENFADQQKFKEFLQEEITKIANPVSITIE